MNDKSNGLATAGMVLGIVALAIVWIPFLGLLALPTALVGAPLSAVGFARARRVHVNRGQAIAGLATNLVALALFFVVAASFLAVLGEAATQ